MKSEHGENGERRTVWVPETLDLMIENTRGKLGMNRSSFYKYALIKLLQELSILTEKAHSHCMHAVPDEGV